MCGIAGFFYFDIDRKANEELLKKITDCISHRGPDGEGYYCHNNIALGHRRLSIIDLSSGDQPMFSDDGTLVVVFNGEIYNYIEIREELRKLGYSFKTSSDTEVIIKSYEHWGEDCQNKFNGMWAFALWDSKQQRLFISRDRVGEKPLFYANYNNTLIFGSEIKSILQFGHPAIPNHEMTELYLTLSYVPAPYTFYKGIHKLQPGHYLIVSNNNVREIKYWDIPEIDESNMISEKGMVNETFENLLSDSVKIRMRSDVPFGAFLSGGLDSSSIVALMSEVSKTPVQTFTIGFKEKYFDERKLARLVAEKFNTQHLEYQVEPDSFDESIRAILNQFDEPFGDSSAIPTGNVSKIAAQKVKMVLTGDGGDEVLSGYTPYQGEKFAERYQHIPAMMRKQLPGLINGFGSAFSGNIRYKLNRGARVLASSDLSFNDRLMSKMWCPPQIVEQLIEQPGKQHKLEDFLSDFYNRYPVNDPFYKLMYFHLKVLLPDDYLVKVDRMSMASSLETRVPFLDYRLIEFMTKVHRNLKMEGYTRKSILRNTIGKRLPQQLLTAPKKGFGVPLREWFKDSSFDEKLRTLYSSDIGLNKKVIRQMTTDNASGKQDLGNFLWMLFIYKDWIESNGDRTKSETFKA